MNKSIIKVLLVTTVLIEGIFGLTNKNAVAWGKAIKTMVVPVNKMATDKGINIKIGDAIKEGEERITLEYSIKSERDFNTHNVMERPDVSIDVNGNKINASPSYTYKKLGKGDYRGAITIIPVRNLPNHYKMKFNVDSILDQPGQWTINFSL